MTDCTAPAGPARENNSDKIMKTEIDSNKATVTRKGMTWTFSQTSNPKFFARICAEYGDEIVSSVLTAEDYYPPMIDASERLAIDDACTERFIALGYAKNPNLRPALEALGYTADEASAS